MMDLQRMAKTSMRLAVLFGASGLLACTDPQPTTNDPTGETHLTLSQDNAGDLAYCDAAERCVTVSNPEQCEVLELTIDNGTGAVCERCVDADGNLVFDRCQETHVACTLVTAPEPDCLVCAHVDGPVIYSSCIAAAPTVCTAMPSPDGRNCEICYDANGGPVYDSCGPECGNIACPAVMCAEGFVMVVPPGECCPQCLPPPVCTDVLCSNDFTVPECPLGSVLQRDPTDCCGFYCAPNVCDMMMCPMIALLCPDGMHPDYGPPHCCGTCVPDDITARFCRVDVDCGDGFLCTTTLGACLPSPMCDPNMEMPCTNECWGVCQPQDYICPAAADAAGSSGVPEYMPPADLCAGQWIPGGFDALGCPLPPVCVCVDGSISFDGLCADQCAQTACFAPPPTCEPGSHLVLTYPYCCGACLPDDPVTLFCTSDLDCTAGSFCSTQLGDCQVPPDCAVGGTTGCVAVCYGVCMVGSGGCFDSDGLDPFVAGTVSGSDGSGVPYEYSDLCSDDGHTLTEFWCYESPLGSGMWVAGQAAFPCGTGCSAGACLR